ncbi:hypothetical protein LXL04_017877 [Taraxacum kok-saghyz]
MAMVMAMRGYRERGSRAPLSSPFHPTASRRLQNPSIGHHREGEGKYTLGESKTTWTEPTREEEKRAAEGRRCDRRCSRGSREQALLSAPTDDLDEFTMFQVEPPNIGVEVTWSTIQLTISTHGMCTSGSTDWSGDGLAVVVRSIITRDHEVLR